MVLIIVVLSLILLDNIAGLLLSITDYCVSKGGPIILSKNADLSKKNGAS